MRPPADGKSGATPSRRTLRFARFAVTVLAAVVLLIGAHIATEPGSRAPALIGAGETTTTSVTTTTIATTSTLGSSTTTTEPPPQVERSPQPEPAPYQVASNESAPEVKQLAVDIAHALTTYEAATDHVAIYQALDPQSGVELLAASGEPLVYENSWSQGEVIYPQMGGLRNDKASVMVVIRQTVGIGADEPFSVVRTLDIRLVKGADGWEFDFLDSAGGVFEDVEHLENAHAVAANQRIEMPDTARLDILSGLVSPKLLSVMADLAEQTPYGVVVLSTGHPHHVFETDRVSHHTIGQAVDIYRIGETRIIDDRSDNSDTRAIVQWLYENPDVLQVGSPWDIDGDELRRSFTDEVHWDHIHIAVDE